MGLDIYHFLVQSPIAGMRIDFSDWFFETKEFSPVQREKLRIAEFAKLVEKQGILTRIFLFDTIEDRLRIQALASEKGLQDLEWDDGPKSQDHYLDNDGRHIDEQLDDLENLISHPHNGRGRYRHQLLVEDDQPISFWIADYWGQYLVKGVLGHEIGYQRKGMIRDFYTTYEPSSIFTDFADFEHLLSFIEDQKRTSIEPNFKENFLERFVDGQSFLFICY